MAKIAVIGAGNVGSTLGRAWMEAGHQVMYGTRSPEATSDRLRAPAGLPSEAAADADVILLAVPGVASHEVIASIVDTLDGTLVIDATNRIGGSPMHSIEAIHELAPRALPYRAFNTLGWENFANPRFGGEVADLFFCGADGGGRMIVEALISDVGLRPVWVGDLGQLPVVEALASLWFALALQRGLGRHLAFRTLRDP